MSTDRAAGPRRRPWCCVLLAAVLAVAETALTHLGRARAEAIDNARSGKTKDRSRDDDGNGNGSAEDTDPAHAGVLVGLLARRSQFLNPILLPGPGVPPGAGHARGRRGLRPLGHRRACWWPWSSSWSSSSSWPRPPRRRGRCEHTDVAALRVAPAGARRSAALAPLRWVLAGPHRADQRPPAGQGPARRARSSPRRSCSPWPRWPPRTPSSRPAERALIESIIEFGDTVVREVMVPRTDMVTVGADFRVADVMEVVPSLNGYSRLPVCGEGIDDIVGIVYAKDLMRAERDGQRRRAGRRAAAPRPVRARDQAGGRAAARDAGRAVPHGDRRRRVRRHRRAGHARGPHRGAGRRDRRRVRRRGAHGRARCPAAASGSTPAWPSTRSTTCSAPSCPRATGTPSAASCFHLLGHVPAEGETVEVDGLPPARPSRSRAGASAGSASTAAARRRPGAADDGGDRRRVPRSMRSGFVTLVGRPNVGQVHAAQPDPRHQGGDHLRQAADHPHARSAGVLNRPDAQVVFVDTPGHPQAPHPARRAAQRHGQRAPSATSTWCAWWSTPPRPSARATSSWPTRCPTDAVVVVNKIDIAAARRGAAPSCARPPTSSTARRLLPGVGQDRRRRRRARRRPHRAGCPRARRTTPRTWSPTCPRRSGWPSWCASSCWPSPTTSCRTRSPPGSPSGSGPASASRSSSSATPRRAS